MKMTPETLRTMNLDQLRELAEDIRQEIITTCLRNGGHLGASLGAVEIAIALHRCFESPREPIVWDVGHQAYAHKLLTGRWDEFKTLRKTGGISGFLSRGESEHDAFGAGHSSTSLSAALAMAWARGQSAGKSSDTSEDWTVAVIGDGGLTAGVAFEALNNVRALSLGKLLVVLNDNQMSISNNVGAMPAILSGAAGGEAREFFEFFGFDYAGPVDGHDLGALIGAIEGVVASTRGNRATGETAGQRPIILHAITQKGKGYAPAEESPAAFHGVSPVQQKVPDPTAPAATTFSDAFGEALIELAAKDARVVALTAAMPDGTGLAKFSRTYPDRFFDVGIAEPHAVTFAAGLATQGFRPVVAIYSTFLQRALDAIIHDVALQNLPVVIAVDRAGLAGADGPTHHGTFDLTYLSMIPGMTIFCPSCLDDVPHAMSQALSLSGPSAIRYPRGSGVKNFQAPLEGTLRWHRRAAKPKVIAVALGMSADKLARAATAADASNAAVTVVSTLSAKPIAPALIEYLVAHPDARVLVAEEGAVRGGFGETLLAEVACERNRASVRGIADHFVTHGSISDLEKSEGLTTETLASELKRLLS